MVVEYGRQADFTDQIDPIGIPHDLKIARINGSVEIVIVVLVADIAHVNDDVLKLLRKRFSNKSVIGFLINSCGNRGNIGRSEIGCLLLRAFACLDCADKRVECGRIVHTLGIAQPLKHNAVEIRKGGFGHKGAFAEICVYRYRHKSELVYGDCLYLRFGRSVRSKQVELIA